MKKPSSANASASEKKDQSNEGSARAGKYVKYAIGEVILVVVGPAV
jgi:hypothetical protein